MKLIKANNGAKRARLVWSLTGLNTVKVGKNRYKLSRDIEKVKVTYDHREVPAFRAFLIVLIGCTVVGLPIAVGMWKAAKKKQMIVAMHANDGVSFSLETTQNYEVDIFTRYSAIGALDD